MVTRRDFLKLTGATAGAAALAATSAVASTATTAKLDPERIGVLADLTLCIGCRRCEWGCAQQNKLPYGSLESCDDQGVLKDARRPDAEHFTVINRYPAPAWRDQPLDVKVQCMHCEKPACVSA